MERPFILYMFLKSNKSKDIGQILLGFAVLMFGMESMSDAVAPLKDVPEFPDITILSSASCSTLSSEEANTANEVIHAKNTVIRSIFAVALFIKENFIL